LQAHLRVRVCGFGSSLRGGRPHRRTASPGSHGTEPSRRVACGFALIAITSSSWSTTSRSSPVLSSPLLRSARALSCQPPRSASCCRCSVSTSVGFGARHARWLDGGRSDRQGVCDCYQVGSGCRHRSGTRIASSPRPRYVPRTSVDALVKPNRAGRSPPRSISPS